MIDKEELLKIKENNEMDFVCAEKKGNLSPFHERMFTLHREYLAEEGAEKKRMQVEEDRIKEKLLKIKENLERLAGVFEKGVEEALEDQEYVEEAIEDQEYNELMLTLVNNELQLMDEEVNEQFVSWDDQMDARYKKVAEKRRKDRQYNRIKKTMIEDGLGDKFLNTEHLIKEMVYNPKEYNAKELKAYTEAIEKVRGAAKATANDEGGKND